MGRITPARIVGFIDRTWPWAQKLTPPQNPLHRGLAVQLGAIVALCRRLPPELLPSDPDAFFAFFLSVEAIESGIEQWKGLSSAAPVQEIDPLPALNGASPLSALRYALSTCPEEGIAPTIHGLEFVADTKLRDSIRRDLSQSRRALDRGDFKAATVMAGAALEALLLYAIETRTAVDQRKSALSAWQDAPRRPQDAEPPGKLKANIARWDLANLTWIAAHADVISPEAASNADVARDYRNLIHPGRERAAAPSDEGTALSTLGAAVRVAAELEASARRGNRQP